ncbi:hypothetical protein ACLOJK_034220 [Asimina triloba]
MKELVKIHFEGIIIQVHCRSTDFGTPSSLTTHRPTHFRRGSDQSIGAVQKIGHEEMINRGQRSIKQSFITNDREQMGETHQIQRRAAPPPSSTTPASPPSITMVVLLHRPAATHNAHSSMARHINDHDSSTRPLQIAMAAASDVIGQQRIFQASQILAAVIQMG